MTTQTQVTLLIALAVFTASSYCFGLNQGTNMFTRTVKVSSDDVSPLEKSKACGTGIFGDQIQIEKDSGVRVCINVDVFHCNEYEDITGCTSCQSDYSLIKDSKIKIKTFGGDEYYTKKMNYCEETSLVVLSYIIIAAIIIGIIACVWCCVRGCKQQTTVVTTAPASGYQQPPMGYPQPGQGYQPQPGPGYQPPAPGYQQPPAPGYQPPAPGYQPAKAQQTPFN